MTIVGDDSFRYYPGSAGSALDDLQRNESQATVADEHRTQLLCVRRLHGGLTIGVNAEHDEPLAFDVGEAPYAYLADIVEEFLGPVHQVRWTGYDAQPGARRTDHRSLSASRSKR